MTTRPHRHRHPKAAPPPSLSRREAAVRSLIERPGTEGESQAAQAALERLRASYGHLKGADGTRPPRVAAEVPITKAPPPTAPIRMPDELVRLRLHLDRLCDRTDPCPCCRPGCIAILRPADGDDAAPFGLECVVCTKLRGYLPRAAEAELRRLYAAGRMSALPVLGDSSVRG